MVDKYHLLQLEAPPWMELIPPADELGDILTPFLTVEVSGDILQGSLLYLGDQIPLPKATNVSPARPKTVLLEVHVFSPLSIFCSHSG